MCIKARTNMDETFRQTNLEILQTAESDYKKCFGDLLRDYDDRMEMAVPDDELDSITPTKLAKSHEKCEERIVKLFLSGTKFDNENIQKKAVSDLKAQTAARLANKSEKVHEIAQRTSSEASEMLDNAIQKYQDGMAALLRNRSPTDVQIQEKHELQRMMAETEFSSVVYVVKSREESSRLKGLLERKIQEELKRIQSQVRKQREHFRSQWNGHVDDAGKKYSDLMKRMLGSPNIFSNDDVIAHREKLVETIVREAAQDSWIPADSREQMQSDIRQRLLEKSEIFFNPHERSIQEAEESARNEICLFTKSHEKALKDRINSGKDSINEEEFKRLHECLLGECKVLFQSKWSQRLPKNSLVKVIDEFVNGGEKVFSTNMKTVQSLVRDKMKGIREIIMDCCETYEIELDAKMDCAINSGDSGLLEKYHKSATTKAEKEFKKAMKEYALFPKAEEMKSEFEKEILKIFEKKKDSLENELVKLTQGMDDLGNSALEFYRREMSKRKMGVSGQEGLRAAHTKVLRRAIKHLERNFAGTLGNLTVAQLQDEKNKLEEKLAEQLPLLLEEWIKMDQAIDTETRKVIHGMIKGYIAKMANKLLPYAYVSKQFLQLEHDTLLQEGLKRIKEVTRAKSNTRHTSMDKIRNELRQIFEGYVKENDANQRRVEESIVRRSEEREEGRSATFSSYREMNDLKMESAIGIDLGATYSCVGVYRKGKVEIIPERNGHNKTIPSYVLFEPVTGNVLVGDTAKDQSQIYPHLAIFDSKRLVGRWYSDEEVRQDIMFLPFTVVEDDKSSNSKRPKIQIEDKTYFPEEISAKILETLKANAEAHLGHPVKKAVITVPDYFNYPQKVGTREAAQLAGLEVLELLSEPTAAAMAYNLRLNPEDDGANAKNIFVYDLGGGTFDVSVLTAAGGKLEVKAVGGNSHLGGQDFDHLMVRFCIDEFERMHGIKVEGPGATGSTLDKSQRLRRIQHKCEEQKKKLSKGNVTRVFVDRLHGELDMDVDVTREIFNRLIEPLLQETIRLAMRTLEDAKLTANDIGEVILGKCSF
jgi:hypothetical protein